MTSQLDGLFVSKVLMENKNLLMKNFRNSSDFVVYEFEANSGIKALIAYVDGLVDKEQLNRDLIKPFILNAQSENIKKSVCISTTKEVTTIKEAVSEILNGNVVLFVQNEGISFSIDLKGWFQRSIELPDIENVIRGPKEGFVESIRVNTSLLRRKIKNNKLVLESITLGEQTNTAIEIAYIEDYYLRPLIGTLLRGIRFISFIYIFLFVSPLVYLGGKFIGIYTMHNGNFYWKVIMCNVFFILGIYMFYAAWYASGFFTYSNVTGNTGICNFVNDDICMYILSLSGNRAYCKSSRIFYTTCVISSINFHTAINKGYGF